MALAARRGLAALLTERLRIATRGGANATAKILTLIAGMIAGAFHARARTATLRAQLINTPGRIARSADRLTLRDPDAARDAVVAYIRRAHALVRERASAGGQGAARR